MANTLGHLPGTVACDEHGPMPLEEGIDPIQFQDDGNGPGKGLSLDRHVHFILRDHPTLWEMVDRFNLGEFDRGDGWGLCREHLVGPDALSGLQVEIVQTIIAVSSRRRLRELEERAKPRAD